MSYTKMTSSKWIPPQPQHKSIAHDDALQMSLAAKRLKISAKEVR